jgi:PAS domain S-box-containing protein
VCCITSHRQVHCLFVSIDDQHQPILLVVDDEDQATKLVSALQPDGFSFSTILLAENQLNLPVEVTPCLAILWFSFSSPEAISELEFLVSQLTKMGQGSALPVLLIIDQSGYQWVEPGFRLGVTDVLTRPIHPLVLRQRVRLILGARQTERAVEAHRQAEERFRTVSDFTYDWEYWIGSDGQLIYNSPACERITGYSRRAFIEDPAQLLGIVHPEDQARLREHFQLERNTDQTFSLDFRILTQTGEERWIGHACQPVFSDQGKPLGRRVSNRDHTQRIQAEQAVLRAEKLAAMGRLLASLAHEINNPLQAMSANIELVLDFPLPEAEKQAHLEAVRQEINRLAEINRGILDFARPRQLSLQPVPLQEIVERALFLANSKIKENHVEVSMDFPASLPLAEAAPDQVEQVVLNLIMNALEQMPQGGSLCIKATAGETSIKVMFEDTGPGISPAAQDMIFEPFYTTKKDGTGLGLAISQRIIQQHGGSLSAASLTGGGAEFTIVLPVFKHPVSTQSEGNPCPI